MIDWYAFSDFMVRKYIGSFMGACDMHDVKLTLLDEFEAEQKARGILRGPGVAEVPIAGSEKTATPTDDKGER